MSPGAIGGAGKLFEDDQPASAPTRDFMTKYLQSFAAWIERHAQR